MNDGNRGSPVPLTRNQPVPQSVVLGRLSSALGLQFGRDLRDGFGLGQSIERTGVDQYSVAWSSYPRCCRVIKVSFDDNAYRQVKGARKIEVPLVVSWHRHDRARAVIGQDIFGGVNRQSFIVDWVDRKAIKEHASLRTISREAINVRSGFDFLKIDIKGSLDFRRCFTGKLGC